MFLLYIVLMLQYADSNKKKNQEKLTKLCLTIKVNFISF